MRVISLTGGIGSGKSEVLKILERDYHAVVIQADQVAKELMEPGQAAYEAVVACVGTGILNEGGRIDRDLMSRVIFANPSLRGAVDAIVHPLVWEEIQRRIDGEKRDLVIVEAALFDRERYGMFDRRWYLFTDRERRVKRLMAARGYTMEKCLSIMESQPTDEGYRAECQDVIDNNRSLEETRRQLRELIEKEA